MITKSEKVRLGIFLVASLAVVVAAIIALAGIRLMTSYDVYYTHFDETVSGLEKGAQIKYNGVRVGQVSEIKIDPNKLDRVIVTLELRQGTPIRTDTQAMLRGMGITGLKFVELTGGSAKAERVPPGGEITSGRSLLGMIEGKAEDIAVKTELLITKLNLLFSKKNIVAIEGIIANIDTLTNDTKQLVARNDEKIDLVIDDLKIASNDLKAGMAAAKRSAKRVESMVQSAKPKVERTVDDVAETAAVFKSTVQDLVKVDGVLKKVEQTFDNINNQLNTVEIERMAKSAQRTINETEKTVKSVRRIVESSRENIFRASKSLRNMLQNLEQLSVELRDQPSLIINSDPPEDRTPSE